MSMRSTGTIEVGCSMVQEGDGGPSWTSDAGCVVSEGGGRIVNTAVGCVVGMMRGWVVAQSWCALSVGSMVGAASWAHAPGAVDMVQCIGDAGHTHALAPAWRALSTGSVLVVMSASCTMATASFIMQPWCVSVLRSIGATCAVGQSVAQTARHTGIGLLQSCAPHTGDVAGVSFTSCAVAAVGMIMRPHCSIVLGVGDMAGTSSASCVTAIACVHTLRYGGVTRESIGAIRCSVMWVHDSGAMWDGRVAGPSEDVGRERGGNGECRPGSREGCVTFDMVTCHMVMHPCHIECCVDDSGSQAFHKGIEVVHSWRVARWRCRSTNQLAIGVGNTADVTGENLNFRGP
ncbi:hypothetical protein BKA93DRAFT_753033 [Sparassis latifolia]